MLGADKDICITCGYASICKYSDNVKELQKKFALFSTSESCVKYLKSFAPNIFKKWEEEERKWTT